MVEFAEEIGRPLDPWQRWVVIHGMELQPDGLPRFRQLLILVARQNGKTELLVVLSLFWMFVQLVPLILGTSTKLEYAQESWEKAIKLALASPLLECELPRTQTRGVRRVNGNVAFTNIHGCRYKIAASNEEGGRSLTVHRLIEDELRQHRAWDAHEAAENAMNAVDDAQAWAISNAGDARSVVLNSFLEDGRKFIATGEGDRRLFIANYSPPLGSDPTDPDALAMANPNLGRRIALQTLLGKAERAKAAGGEQLTKFLTEVLCQTVPSMVPPPITVAEFAACTDPGSDFTGRPVFSIVVARDLRSAGIFAAGHREDGRPHVEIVEYRSGVDWVVERAAELKRHRPIAWVLDKKTPAAALLPDLKAAGIKPHEMNTTEYAQACSLLQSVVRDGSLVHLGDEVLLQAVAGADRRDIGEGWAWNPKTSEVDIVPLVGVTLAHWLLSVTPKPRPLVAFK